MIFNPLNQRQASPSTLVRVCRSSLVATALFCSATLPAYSADNTDGANPNANYFIGSFATNQLMLFNELTGTYEKTVATIETPVASQIGFDGDLFLPSFTLGNIYRFDGFTGEYKGIFIHGGEGGLTNPSAPDFGLGPDGLLYVGDFATNKVLRFDRNGNFVDVFADHETSGLDKPYMPTFDETSFYIASGGTNSVLRWDIKTKKFLGAFVPPGSGGLVRPIGMEFGPDGNLYVGSNGTNSVLRYNGKTGEFMDVFIPPGTAGIDNLYSVRFGGPNSNMYVVSSNNNKVIEFDRTTGEFVRVVSDGGNSGISGTRGLTFTPRPIFHVYADVAQACDRRQGSRRHVHIDYRLKDFSDKHPHVALISIESSDPYVNIKKAVAHARYGKADYDFDLSFENTTGIEQHYTITYKAKNSHGLTTISTTEVAVPAE